MEVGISSSGSSTSSGMGVGTRGGLTHECRISKYFASNNHRGVGVAMRGLSLLTACALEVALPGEQSVDGRLLGIPFTAQKCFRKGCNSGNGGLVEALRSTTRKSTMKAEKVEQIGCFRSVRSLLQNRVMRTSTLKRTLKSPQRQKECRQFSSSQPVQPQYVLMLLHEQVPTRTSMITTHCEIALGGRGTPSNGLDKVPR
jgi:hypothetical protein